MTSIRRGRQTLIETGLISRPIAPYEEPRECCNKAGADRIARMIIEKWASKGYAVNIKLIQQEYNATARSTRWDIRSDMINGLPKDHPLNASSR